ncbi:hypothetical protein [Bradyrhizobium sp. CB2312]|uniref:hypothetical protein n=1 Tax=Bradyrhizobium sp. CB2312 TaxID=3039155 RepID=UPI0024B05F9F|nr:hypothetical protein [Bradyrhizobium sp. CB2312]WFU69272.1 hypothetical protein QA642_28785 [Bradyrhizobium sp. CB2312]
MRKLIWYAPGEEQNDLLKDANACATSRGPAEPPIAFAQPAARQRFPHGRAVVLIAVSVLAATSGAETRAFSEAAQEQRPVSAGPLIIAGARSASVGNASTRLMQAAANNSMSRQAPEEHHGAELVASEFGTAKDSYLSGRHSSEKTMHISQAAVSDIGQSVEHGSAERRSCELTVGTRALGLLHPLEPKHHQADLPNQGFTGNRHEKEAQTALAAKGEEGAAPPHVADRGAAELRASLQQERERASQLERDLASAKRDVETQAALATKANEETNRLKQAAESDAMQLKRSLQQEHDKAEALVKELSTARTRTYAYEAQARKTDEQLEDLKKRAGDNGAAELRKLLQQERERASQLEEDLASAKRDVETQTALVTKAQDETSRLKQAVESNAQLKRSLQQERDKAEALAKELSSARTQTYAYEAQARKTDEQLEDLKRRAADNSAAELRKLLQQERKRASQLGQDLASAKRDVETQTALVTKAQDETSRLKQAAESDATQLKRSLQQERDKAEALAKEFQAAHATRDEYEPRARNESGQIEQPKKVLETDSTDRRKSLHQEQVSAKQIVPTSERTNKPALTAAVVANAGPIPGASSKPEGDTAKPLQADQIRSASVGAARPDSADEDAAGGRLVARARMLLEQGDIGAARIVLERATERGSAQAVFTLAETYDPYVLPKWSTVGTLGDATKARELYAKAEAIGNTQAKQRLEALR